MPLLSCCVCADTLLDSVSVLPENVYLSCGKCRACPNFYSTRNAGVFEADLTRTVLPSSNPEVANVPQPIPMENVTVKALEEVVEWKILEIIAPMCDASTSEVYLRVRNRKSLILCGLSRRKATRTWRFF